MSGKISWSKNKYEAHHETAENLISSMALIEYENKIVYEPPSHSLYIRNGTCAPKGAFPWVVQIQVMRFKTAK